MIKIYLLDLWVVQTVIFRIFLIIKNGLDSIKGKYRAANILSKAISASLFPHGVLQKWRRLPHWGHRYPR